jgi:transcriptional regulator with XRE-family HTH domain
MATARPGKLRQLLAKNVRRYRHALGLSQEELAHRAKLHRTYLGMIERCERNLSVDNIEKLARALEVKPHQLLMD